jgi:hypothetical protein
MWKVCRVRLEGVPASCGLGRRPRRHRKELFHLSPWISQNASRKNPNIFLQFVQLQLFDKICLYQLGFEEHICSNLSEYEDENYLVQEEVNKFNLYKSIMSNALGLVASMFVGEFADRFGMKACITMSLVGEDYTCTNPCTNPRTISYTICIQTRFGQTFHPTSCLSKHFIKTNKKQELNSLETSCDKIEW